MGIKRFLLTCLVLGALPAEAAAEETTFEVDGVHFSMPIPKGMCASESPPLHSLTQTLLGGAGKVAKVFVACDAKRISALIVFAPDVGTMQVFDREEVLDGLASAYTAADAAKYDQQFQQRLEADLTQKLGHKVSAPGEYGYIGRDLGCVYLSGKLNVILQAKRPVVRQIDACLTASGGKMIFVYAIGEMLSLQQIAKEAAMSIRQRD